jgi:hypothetical protein
MGRAFVLDQSGAWIDPWLRSWLASRDWVGAGLAAVRVVGLCAPPCWQINVYALGACFMKFTQLLNIQLPLIDPSLYIHRFVAKVRTSRLLLPPPPSHTHTLSPARYPGVVREEKFCNQPYGCAFDEIMTDPAAIYIKLDDDIVFIKDGSFEHLVWQVGTW